MQRFLVALALLVGLALPAEAQPLAEKLESARLATRATIALAQDEALRAFTFETAASGGRVTVAGTVETAAQRNRVAEVVQALEGVTGVANNVRVGEGAAPDLTDLPPVAEEAPEPEAPAAEPAAEPEPEPEPEKVYYTVRRGDTLGAIARRNGVSVRQLQTWNGIRGSRIRIGQRLRVK